MLPADKNLISLPELTPDQLANLCGPDNQFITHIESRLHCQLSGHPGHWHIDTEGKRREQVQSILLKLASIAQLQSLKLTDIEHALREVALPVDNTKHPARSNVTTDTRSTLSLQAGRRQVQGKTPNQKLYLDSIQSNTLTLSIGPAGCGKTYLAVATAVVALTSHQVERIILTRPAVEAGERLGFLPGDMQQKVDPYLRPLFDALTDMLGVEKMNALMEQGRIEIAPLAYMRGRTLNDAFIILDEAQNTTRAQMKMFLTRLGFSSKMVVTGDVTQIDLPAHQGSGLDHALKVLAGLEGIGICRLGREDVVRHHMVERIVAAYENDSNLTS
ncbi:MAG: phosphate starvation-inducible protein PhoH [Zetaproteobacteria bacterium CG_4_9_14_3_um_filter_49_83]|nr:MAG: phosphate starvation-inducible protein PhoH [Zetaproteobacteria bacterium CG1_02_49_23]PIQ29961.1 MAG: phosphate starvation-inducible protein PhoH [Zetaproteobacteria bacterium CG17_big_fil_post_rev_8_21_14_2_50_50_13]PIV31458.1 MAG: phosphate starvation-inducible protein PhoH [Zetaproteobacteria bacterium CG02_land_8_20_14_3_00_50_9]PIY55020.1 MAG: phosphate starvation-inducible protein PhoH [Zetaproteobacteria bacterium CG_4_10_14_0_8_um_filter_49_80]PJA36528.1 MAG: phosphate starvati